MTLIKHSLVKLVLQSLARWTSFRLILSIAKLLFQLQSSRVPLLYRVAPVTAVHGCFFKAAFHGISVRSFAVNILGDRSEKSIKRKPNASSQGFVTSM